MKKTLEELKTLYQIEEEKWKQEELERDRISLSLQLGFCPDCGESIICSSREITEIKEVEYLFFFKKKVKQKYWLNDVFCSVSPDHYKMNNKVEI